MNKSNEMKRVYNFSPGPAQLPQAVLEKVQHDLLNWQGSGMSSMEVSHRSAAFMEMTALCEKNLRELLSIPENYEVLFLQGGASGQFSAIPLNLRYRAGKAAYIKTGHWGEKAITEGKRYIDVDVLSDTSADFRVPKPEEWQFEEEYAYLHYTPNETITGVEFSYIPASGITPLVADFSSTLLSRPIDVSQFGVIYAGAQKNIAPAGMVILIVRKDLINGLDADLPTIFNWKKQSENHSMFNTPATFSWYVAGEVFAWLKAQGGLKAMGEINKQKAEILYAFIDDNEFYNNPIEKGSRSWMNIPFTLRESALETRFLERAETEGLTNLKGHRVIGGMRASIYNSMPLAGVEKLIEFMAEFAKQHG